MSRNKKACPGDPTRRCWKCRNVKPVSEFMKNKKGVDGVGTLCKACKRMSSVEWRGKNPEHNREWMEKNRIERQLYERKRNLRRFHGITLEQYEDLLAYQGGVCAICRENPGTGNSGTLHVDHDHGTGNIRGLLCHGCNTSLGHLKDNVASLQRAIYYLEESQWKTTN